MRWLSVMLPLLWLALLAGASSQQTTRSLPHFPTDAVYVYSYRSLAQLPRDVNVEFTAEVSVYALPDSGSEGDSQELVYTVTETQLTWTTHNRSISDDSPLGDLTNWFSALREDGGSISTVLYPYDESSTVLAFKKTLAKLFSVDLNLSNWAEDESNIVLTRNWVERADRGVGDKHASIATTVDAMSGAVLEVTIYEWLSSQEEGTDSGMLLDRPMHSHSTLSLLTQHSSPLTPHRPHNLIRDDITITSSMKSHVSLETLSPDLLCTTHKRDCARHLEEAIQLLSEEDIATLSQQYFNETMEGFSLSQALDLLSALSTSHSSPFTTHLLTSLLLPSAPHPLPNKQLLSKLLFHLTTSLPPDELSIERVWSLVLERNVSPAIQTQALLALGAMARRVRPIHPGLATQIVADLHHLLEQHTGYSMPHTLHKHRRSPLPTLSSSLPHSSLHALLLDCLANAGADESFPTLEHHLFIGDLSVRHAAVRGLRNYATDESAEALLSLTEEPGEVHPSLTQAAVSAYQAHPRRKRDLSDLLVQSSIQTVASSRSRRQSAGENMMNVTMPTVGWNRQFGESNISADISRTISNAFILDTADLSTQYHFSLHDETTMSSHLALSDGASDFEMMRTQLCLEGTAFYDDVNILTEFTPELTSQQYTLHSDASVPLAEGFEAAYDQLVASDSAYNGIRDTLITELDDLIDVHFEDIATRLSGTLSRLDSLQNDFILKSTAWDIHSAIWDRYTSSRDSAQTSVEAILSELNEALPSKPAELQESLLVEGQPFTTHSFHVPYLPFAPQKALVNILDVYKNTEESHTQLQTSVQSVIDLISPYGPNHAWVSPSLLTRQISDDLSALIFDLRRAIDEADKAPTQSYDGASLTELQELHDIVDSDLMLTLDLLVGVASDVIRQSAALSAAQEGSREAFTGFTISYDNARSTVDAIFGQKFHPSFPRERRSCDHERGCGSFPTTSDQGYGEGVALVMSDGEQIVAPLSGYYSLSPALPPPYVASTTISLTPTESSYFGLTFTLSHILPSAPLTATPIFIRGGDPLGIFNSEPQALNTEDEYYIHLEAHKTVENETFTIDPTQFLQPILEPQVRVEYECNDLVTYIGSAVVDRRPIAPDTPERVEVGTVLVDDTIPGHEFPRPVDSVLQSQGTVISGSSAEVFSSSTFVMVGPIPVQFDFRAVGDYQLDYSLSFSLLSRQSSVSITPSLTSRAQGEMRMGGMQYATVKLEGSVLEASLPLELHQLFLEWPLTASSQMDLVLSPSSLSLTSQLAQTTGAGEFASEEILQTDTLWYYSIPSLNRDEFYYQGSLTDVSPPEFITLPYADSDCAVRQLALGDFYSPSFEIEFTISEPQGLSSIAYQIGSASKTDNIIENSRLGGSRIVIPHQLIPASPIYVTVTATNLNGQETLATCSLSSYDRSPPLARITPIRPVSSQPNKISVLFSLFDEYGLDTPLQVAIGTVPGDYGYDVMDWVDFDLSEITTPPTDGGDALDLFSFKQVGRLLTEVRQVSPHIPTPSQCAEECVSSDACRSFDHSPAEANCILHSGIEGPQSETTTIENVFETPPLQLTSDYGHYERLGVGNSTVLEFSELSLEHNTLYYINMRLMNGLGFTSVASSTPFLVDFTPPTPGHLRSAISDTMEFVPCEELSVGGLLCIDHITQENHRVIVDGPGSAVVFNGPTPLLDAMYTSTANYITASWDGFEDQQSGLHIYQWWVGSTLGNDDIIPPTDPHMHLAGGQSSWTNSGLATGLALADGSYYISVQAISNIEYGGPLATTFHHSTAYVLDTSPPLLNDMIITEYSISSNQLEFSYNASDEESGLRSVSLSLGRTEHDTAILGWTGVGTAGNGAVTVNIPDGVDTWVKLRATNNAGLSSIAVAEMAIRVDRSPPLVSVSGDGDNVMSGDIDYQSSSSTLCVHGTGISDPESGISAILWAAGTSPESQDTIVLTDVTFTLLSSGSTCTSGHSLLHNYTYYSTLYITNGAINSQTTIATTDGVRVDTTPPMQGTVHTGVEAARDAPYSSDITDVIASWDGFVDYESQIAQYSIDVRHKSSTDADYEIIHTETVDGAVSEITWTHFSFVNGDSVIIDVEARNGAGRRVTATSSPYTIDLSPPHVNYLVDGSDPAQDIEYQSENDRLSISWDVEDLVSGVDTIEIAVLEQREGRRVLFHPDPLTLGLYKEEIDSTLVSYTLRNILLTHGAKYIAVVTFTNGAGLAVEYETSGVTIDLSLPVVSRVVVEGEVSLNQDTNSVEVIVSSMEQVSARWSAGDADSSIAEYLVGIVDENDTYVAPGLVSFGRSSGGVVENLDLVPGSLYRVAVMAVNHAQSESETGFSDVFRVVAGDVSGVVYDGEDPGLIDTDYTDEATAVTAHFSGFLSTRCGGVARYEWAVGVGWEEGERENLMEFTERGIVMDGHSGSGYAQVLLPELATYGAQPLYITIRGITGCGDILQSTSNGFIIDPSPPSLEILGMGENAIEHAQSSNSGSPINHNTYQTTASFSALWKTIDHQSGPQSNITVSIGTYPGGSDVQSETTIPVDYIRRSMDGGEGIPHYVTVTAASRAGVSASTSSEALVLDTSPPTIGQQSCIVYGYPLPLPFSPTFPFISPLLILCEWSDVEDLESGIQEHRITITDNSNSEEIVYETTLPGTSTAFETPSLNLNTTSTYTITHEVTNGAGLRRLMTSEVAPSAVTYTGSVQVLVNYGRTENVSRELTEPERVSSGSSEDAVCLWESDVITITFNTPENEQSVDPESYEVGIGYSLGTDDHHTFTSFTPSLITTGTYSHTLTHIDTTVIGRRPIYITVQARSSDNTQQVFKLSSSPVYIKSTINEQDSWLSDGTDPDSDREYQTSTTEISARFSIGTNCPITYARWSIEDANGTVVQDYVDVEIPPESGGERVNEFALYTDQVRLYNEESYRVLVQAIDYSGEVFILRSDGLTVTTDELVPNIVQDGPNPDEDLNYQEPTDYLSAHWMEFGDGTPQQEIAYYEVAAGSNSGYPNTRTDIAPFTNVGLNTSHTFTNLDLTSESVAYYITVRATAVSGAVVDSTSNSIVVGLTHTIQLGDITVAAYSSNTSDLSAYWEEFESNAPIRSYEWAIGSVSFSPDQLREMCLDYMSTFEDTFEVLPFTRNGLDTVAFSTGLSLSHNTTYYVTIRAIDEANKCIAVTSSGILVDLSDPISNPQSITLGPLESLIGREPDSPYIVFTQSQNDVSVQWGEFSDLESGIGYYEVALFEQTECGSSDNLHSVSSHPAYINTGLDRSFTFKQPDLLDAAAYVVEVRATNLAGLSVGAFSQPILLDSFESLPGTVKDGLQWESDVVFQSDLSMLSGVFSHAKLPPQYPGVVLQNDPCPNTTFYSLTTTDTSWSTLAPTLVGIDSSSITYAESQVVISPDGLKITAEYEEGSVRVQTGAYQTSVDMSQGGLVSLDIQAAMGDDSSDADLEDQSITSVVFIDSVATDVLADFEYESQDSDYPGLPGMTIFGLQIHHSVNNIAEQKVVLWSRSSDTLLPVVYAAHEIPRLSLSDVHTYTLDFQQEQLDVDYARWVDLYIDGELVVTLHGVAELSSTTRMVLHVFNRDGFVPEVEDPFNPPRVEAVFGNVSLPLQIGHVCDSGRPFYSIPAPIVEFSVGVGSSPGLDDVRELEFLSHPCHPCIPGPCSSYACSSNCTLTDPRTHSFTIRNLSLSPGYHTNQSDALSGEFEFESSNTANTMVSLFTDYFQPATYYITVLAVTASGEYIVASSNGVIIDTSPPEQIASIDHFDVSFSTVQPTDFQASNDTISARWAYRDLQSGIVEYQWAIGTAPNRDDIQPFMSVGTATEATNSNLLGALEHNTTYYVTVIATNGAGLSSNATSDGVTYTASVLNGSALREGVRIEFVRSVGGDGEGEGEGAVLVVEREDQAVIIWDVVTDEVEDIFWYIGSSQESGDIFPKTEVSFNGSTRAEFEDGILYLNGVAFASISEIIARAEGREEDNEESFFVFEPGKLVYNTLELCNFVHRCVAVATNPSVLIRPSDAQVTVETDGEDVEFTFTQTQGQSAEVTDREYSITLATSGGLEAGTALLAGFLTHADLLQTYRSTAPYISNPYTTMTQTSQDIARRFSEVGGPSFYVSFLGQDSLNGVLTINMTFDPFLDRDRFMPDVAYWDIDAEVWREVSETCGGSSAVDWTTFTISAEVCSTVVSEGSDSQDRKRRQSESSASGSGEDRDYLDRAVQFIVVGIGNVSANTAPELLLPAEPLSVFEDEILSNYQLQFSDAEGDKVNFYIASPPLIGTASLTLDGLLSYTPCSDCTGVDSFEVYIIEEPFGFNNEPLIASGNLVIEIENVNDNPSLYAYDPLAEKATDITADMEIHVYVESNRTDPVSIAQVAALDVDGYFDDLSVSTQSGSFAVANSEIWLDVVNVLESLPVTSLPGDSAAFLGYITFLAANITYLPHESGSDIIQVRVRDIHSALSSTLTVNVTVVPSWCLNNGVCGGNSADPNCTDIEARRNTPEIYSCSCMDGFTGQYCEVDARVVKPAETRVCPDGIPEVLCEGDPCANAMCPSNASAVCRPNYCGGCRAEWFVGDTLVQCNADDPSVCFKPTTAEACLLSGDTTCVCPKQPHPCPEDSIFIETRHNPCCVRHECRCPESSCPLLMEGGLGVQPVPVWRGNKFPGRCCPKYSFEDINECEEGGENMCSDICVNEAAGYSCDCTSGTTLSQDGHSCGVCAYDGREYLYRDRVKIGCNWCVCRSDSLSGERWHCTARSCDRGCSHNGVFYTLGETLSLPQFSCVCESTDTNAEWKC